jgi:hypothetical protein
MARAGAASNAVEAIPMLTKVLAVTGLLATVPASAFAHGYHRPYYPGRATVYVAPRPHRVWVPGYWFRHGPRPVWINGAWAAPPRAGWVWSAPRWCWEGGRWVWREGTWVAQGPYATSGYVPAPQTYAPDQGYAPAPPPPTYVPDQGYAPAPAPTPSGYSPAY